MSTQSEAARTARRRGVRPPTWRSGQAGHARRLLRMRPFLAAGLVATCGLAGAACGQAGGQAGGGTTPPAASAASPSRDPETAKALLRIAAALNNDYQENKDTAVYSRWDARSQAIISRATYVQRHHQCPNTPHVKVDTWGVAHGPAGAWLVHYSIGGQQFTDWWYYVHGRFVFDLPKSNPSAVALYKDAPAQYVKAIGCGNGG